LTLRRIPRVGDAVTIVYLDAQVRGTIERVSDDQHELEVVTEEHEVVRFRLNRATARFMAADPATRARLVFGAGA
jgi:predicted PP-loop superfamily ATPase